jgi:hypothetical protein
MLLGRRRDIHEAAIFGIQGKLSQGSSACTCVALVGGRRRVLGVDLGRCSIWYSLVAQELAHVGRSRFEGALSTVHEVHVGMREDDGERR